MLARRIIPCLDVDRGRVVKGQRFQAIKDVSDPAELAKRYSLEGADELVFYDITASSEKRAIDHQFVEAVAKEINIPFCVGGGIQSVEDMVDILRKGADKVSINTSAVLNPSLIEEGAKRFGNQCIVVSIDAKKKGDDYFVWTHGGRQETSLRVEDWAAQAVELGAGELVLNSIDQDGEKTGYDLSLIERIVKRVNVPVIASGGAGTVDHFVEAAQAGADGLLAASLFHFKIVEIKAVKDALAKQQIPVRKD